MEMLLQELSSCGGTVVIEEEVSLVTPAGGGRGHGYLYLSSLDLYWRGAPYSRRVLFYEKVGDLQEQEAMVGKLKNSLAQMLLAFYPAAGRLVSTSQASGRPSIHCDGQGVEFVVSHVNATLSGLQTANFEPCPFFQSLARSYIPGNNNQDLLPLLSIQVTKFLCGGLAIGISYSNVLADGHSLWHLMNSWAECARNETISILPYHHREAFKVEDLSQDLAAQFSLPSYNLSTYEELSPVEMVHKLFHITPHMINMMKKQAYDRDSISDKISHSDYDVLCAFMWKSLIASQALANTDHESTNICVLGDMRFRMRPQLPRGYFGNAAIFAYASSSTSNLVEGAFGTIAQKIHEACKACNEPRLWRMVNWLELHENLFKEKRLPWTLACLNVVSSPKFRVYGVDFGWGEPIAVRPAQITNTRDMVLLPGRDGGIDVCLACPRPVMSKLLKIFLMEAS